MSAAEGATRANQEDGISNTKDTIRLTYVRLAVNAASGGEFTNQD